MAITKSLGDGYSFYGNIKLPHIETIWTDKEKYPYATLIEDSVLILSAVQGLYNKTNSTLAFNGGFALCIVIDKVWNQIAESDTPRTDTANIINWTNYNMLDENNEVYCASSIAISLNNMEIIEWDNDTTGLESNGLYYKISNTPISLASLEQKHIFVFNNGIVDSHKYISENDKTNYYYPNISISEDYLAVNCYHDNISYDNFTSGFYLYSNPEETMQILAFAYYIGEEAIFTETLGDGYALYNTIKLPNIDAVWTDKETYPYAVIGKNLYTNNYLLSLTTAEWAITESAYTLPANTTELSFTLINNVWSNGITTTYTEDKSFSFEVMEDIWHNTYISGDTIEYRTPVSLDNMIVIEWNCGIRNLEIFRNSHNNYYKLSEKLLTKNNIPRYIFLQYSYNQWRQMIEQGGNFYQILEYENIYKDSNTSILVNETSSTANAGLYLDPSVKLFAYPNQERTVDFTINYSSDYGECPINKIVTGYIDSGYLITENDVPWLFEDNYFHLHWTQNINDSSKVISENTVINAEDTTLIAVWEEEYDSEVNIIENCYDVIYLNRRLPDINTVWVDKEKYPYACMIYPYLILHETPLYYISNYQLNTKDAQNLEIYEYSSQTHSYNYLNNYDIEAHETHEYLNYNGDSGNVWTSNNIYWAEISSDGEFIIDEERIMTKTCTSTPLDGSIVIEWNGGSKGLPRTQYNPNKPDWIKISDTILDLADLKDGKVFQENAYKDCIISQVWNDIYPDAENVHGTFLQIAIATKENAILDSNTTFPEPGLYFYIGEKMLIFGGGKVTTLIYKLASIVTETPGDGYALYNGVKLPNIESVWTDEVKAELPYAALSANSYVVSLYLFTPALIKTDDRLLLQGECYYKKYDSYTLDYFREFAGNSGLTAEEVFAATGYEIGAWEYGGEHGTNGCYVDWDITWTSHDILNEDETVYLAASEPIPLDGMTVIEWNGRTKLLPTSTDNNYYNVSTFTPKVDSLVDSYAVIKNLDTNKLTTLHLNEEFILNNTNDTDQNAYNITSTLSVSEVGNSLVKEVIYPTSGMYFNNDTSYISLLAYHPVKQVFDLQSWLVGYSLGVSGKPMPFSYRKPIVLYDNTWPIEWNTLDVVENNNLIIETAWNETYSYNGTELPELNPISDETAAAEYSYVTIIWYDTKYWCYYTSTPFTVDSSNNITYGGVYYYSTWTEGNSNFSTPKKNSSSITIRYQLSSCIWSNKNIQDTNGNVQISGSEPVFISKEATEWLTKISDLTPSLDEMFRLTLDNENFVIINYATIEEEDGTIMDAKIILNNNNDETSEMILVSVPNSIEIDGQTMSPGLYYASYSTSLQDDINWNLNISAPKYYDTFPLKISNVTELRGNRSLIPKNDDPDLNTLVALYFDRRKISNLSQLNILSTKMVSGIIHNESSNDEPKLFIQTLLSPIEITDSVKQYNLSDDWSALLEIEKPTIFTYNGLEDAIENTVEALEAGIYFQNSGKLVGDPFESLTIGALEEIFPLSCTTSDNFTFTVTSDQIITIHGEGTMLDNTGTAKGLDFINTAIFNGNIIHIGSYVLNKCNNLTNISIPSTVESIGNYAFSNCSALTEITIAATIPPTVKSNILNSTSALTAIYVPVGSGAAYKAATGWSTYADKIVEKEMN